MTYPEFKFPTSCGRFFRFGPAYLPPREIVGFVQDVSRIAILRKHGSPVVVQCENEAAAGEIIERAMNEISKPFYGWTCQ